MSYSFVLRFRDCSDRAEAFDHALRATECLWKDLRSYLEQEKYYIPSIRYGHATEKTRETDEAWLERVCQLRFIWWEDHKLLAIVGNCWPTLIEDIFPRYHGFQDSCDQDYDYDTWQGLSPQIMRHVNLLREAAPEVIAKILEEDVSDIEDIEYARKSALYQVIFDELALDAWLWGREDSKFTRFSLSCLTSQERRIDANAMLRQLVWRETGRSK